jgi:hypothetical protein
MFAGASTFNQDIGSWNVTKATNMNSMFRYASSFNQNLNAWQIVKVTNLAYMFQNATAFNNGLSSGVSGSFTMATSSALLSAGSVFDGASAFNQDVSTWNTSAVTWATAFVSSTTSSFNQSLAALNVGNYSVLTLTADNTLVNFPASMSSANVLNTIDGWASRNFSKTNMSTFKFRIILSGTQVPYNNCHSYDAYTKSLTWAVYSGGATGTVSAPANCGSTPVVTWTPSTLPANVTFSSGVYRFTPDATPAVTGSNGNYAYVVANSNLAGDCSVSQAGEVTFKIAGSTCDIKVFTTDPNTSIGSVTVTFSAQIAPDAPTINSFTQLSLQRINLNYTVGTNSGSAVTKYQYSTDGGVTWTNESSGINPPTNFLMIGQSTTGNPDFVIGQKYNVKIRAVNTVAGAASNVIVAFVDTAPASPTITGTVPGDKSVSISFTAGTNAGTSIQKYQYSTDNGSHWVDAIGTASPLVATLSTETSTSLVNGTIYLIAIRAVNNLNGTGSLNSSFTPNAPPGAPIVTSITASSATLSVAFTAGANSGSAITKYQYSTDGGTTWRDRASGTTASPLAISTASSDNSALRNGTSYQIQIRAFNTLAGVATASTAAVPEVAPAAPTSVGISPFNGRLDVSFTAGTNTGSAITTYQYSTDGGTSWRTRSSGTTASPISISTASSDDSALINGTSYNVMIRAFNTIAGAISTQVSGIPDTVPEIPTNLVITPSDKQLSVAFSQPLNSGSAITKYQYSTDGGTSWKDRATGTTASPLVITTISSSASNLVNTTSYNIQIRAFNTSAGPATVSISAKPDIVLAAPTIGAITASSGTLTIAFTAPTITTGLTTYQYSTDGGTSWRNRIAGTTASPLVVTTTSVDNSNLVNGTTYDIKLRAFNTVPGSASATSSVALITAPSSPTGALAVRGNTQATVSWTTSSDNGGGAITGYTVTSTPSSLHCATTGATTCVVTGLTNGTSYTFTVTATNSAGTSAASVASAAVVPATVAGAPTLGATVFGDSKITISWSAPASNGGLSISAYTVSTSAGGFTCTTAALTCEITGLTNGTSYTVSVKATNAVGDSIASATATGTPMTTATVPTGVIAVRGNTQASVSWTASSNNGGSAITGYTVTSTPGSFQCTTTGATNCDVTGLTNGTSYTFRVTATNAVGTSAASTASVAVIPATVPGAPTLITPIAGNSTITVSWTAPSNDGGAAITGYTVSTTSGGFTCTTAALTCDLTGLTNGTSYTVSVKATNAIGDSVSSGTYAIRPDLAPNAPTITNIIAGDRELWVYFTLPSGNGGSAISKLLSTMNGGISTAQTTTLTSPLRIQIQNASGTPRLVNGTLYNIQLALSNSMQGAWSVAQSATPNLLPAAPTSVTGVIGGGQVSVSWSASSSNGGTAVTGYTVTSSPGSFTCATTGATTCDVTGLTNGVAYTFSVVATNAMGNSPASLASGAMKPDVAPGAPTGLTISRGDGSLTVSFVAAVNTGSAIAKYQYSFDGAVWSDFATDSNATTQTISGLTNGNSYSVYLRAVNTLFGTASSSVTASPRAAPGAPTTFAVTAGYKQISVSWNLFTNGGGGIGLPGTNGGESITKYQYQLDGGAWVDFAGTSSPQVISGLTNAVSYSVKIRAYSDIAGVSTSALSATPVKLTQTPLVLGIAETVAWSNNNTAATLRYAVNGSLTLQTSGGSGTGQVIYSLTSDSACSVVNSTLLLPNVGAPCRVTATKVSDGDYSSTDSQTVWIVTQRAEQVPLVWKSQTVTTFGGSFDVSVSGGSGSGAITVSSLDTAVCSTIGTRVYAVGAGNCLILVYKEFSTNFNPAVVTQSIGVARATQTVSFTSHVPNTPLAGDTYTVAARATSDANPTFSKVSGDCAVAGAVVSFTASGPCVIRASATKANYFDASITQTINVGQRNQTLSFGSAISAMTSKTYGSPAFFADAATSELTLTPTYALGSATTNSACSVSASGIVQLLAAGDCEIEVTQAGNSAVAAASSISKLFAVLPDQASQPFVTSVSAGHQSIAVSFIKPSYSGGSPITAYRVDAVFAGGVESTSACAVVAGTTQSCTIAGLTNGTSYQVKVAAITLAGAGIFSDLAVARVPATNPAAVSDFAAVPDNTTIALNWADPISLGGGVFDSYRIFYKRSSDASYPSTYINVTSQATNAYTLTGLINGESYDVKIVTVTTANTASLVSNTAEVKETPRTVPDAPATMDVLQVAGNLIITWAAPQSDGGNAISEYSVTVNGNVCSMANALDTLCTVALPTSPGVQPIEVKAKNDAGFGAPAIRSFTIASAPSPSSSSGGSGSGSPAPSNPGTGNPTNPAPGGDESAPSPEEAMKVVSLSITKVNSNGGQVLTVTGKNLAAVTSVLVAGKKARIISVSATSLIFEVPANSNGPATLKLSSPKASLELIDALTYLNGKAKVSVSWILGYVQANSTLTGQAKLMLKAALKAHPATVAITCVGYQSLSYNTPFDAKVAMARANQACNYLKSLNRKLVTRSLVARTNLTGTPSRKLAVQFRPTK